MKVLGINDTHDAGIALIEDGRVLFAINQERVDRIKLSFGFPMASIDAMMNELGMTSLESIDFVALSRTYGKFAEESTKPDFFQDLQNLTKPRRILNRISKIGSPFFRSSLGTKFIKTAVGGWHINNDRELKVMNILKGNGFKGKIVNLDHHLCHAASAVFSCPSELFNEKSLVVTMDAMGDGLSGTVYIAEKGKLKKIHEINQFNSLAMYYSYVTQICGFVPIRHEGKITGLAAYGKPVYLKMFEDMINYKKGSIYNFLGLQHEPAIKAIRNKIGNYKREDLAASIQIHCENVVTKFIDYWINKTKIQNVLVAGGLFANVKINQRINEMPRVNNFFVHQNMGDGGTGFGAGALKCFGESRIYEPPRKDVYFGQGYTNEQIEEELKKFKVKYKKYRFIEKEIARLLCKGKVIARFNGKMEYGPRALGNRTIMYHTKDPSVNAWLNKRLNRTEFMPFAPVTLYEEAEKCYKNMKGAKYSARFMTITFDCTDFMKRKSPAVVHVDGTARPQLIDKDSNPSYRKILEEYYKITKIPSLVNTSFNMHEEPIVCSPSDAIRSFQSGHLDYLAIGDFLVKN